MKVDFMIIGAQKSGTSTLANCLAQHPGVCFCEKKEPHYFSLEGSWEKYLEKYHALYHPARGQLCGEASTSYTFLPEYLDVHSRLYAYNPELKVIYIMRNPVERIRSQFAHDLLRRTIRNPSDVLRSPMYVNRSRYAVQIQPYLELFGSRSILLLLFEDMVRDLNAALETVAAFLSLPAEGFEGIDRTSKNVSVEQQIVKRTPLVRALRKAKVRLPKNLHAFLKQRFSGLFFDKIEEKPEFPAELKRVLWRLLEKDVREVEQLMGRPLEEWRPRPQG